MRCKLPYNKNFVVLAKKHAGGNGNLMINFAWPSLNLCHVHRSTIVKLFRKQHWEDLLHVSVPHGSKQNDISSLYFFVSTSGFHQCILYDQAITMIYRVKNGRCLQEDFPGEIEKRVYRFIAGELSLCYRSAIWINKCTCNTFTPQIKGIPSATNLTQHT